jgi:N-acetylmuramoyl-L-alanine amidase
LNRPKNRKSTNVRAFVLLWIVFCVVFSVDVLAGTGYTVRTVVLDAGHGGKDPGAIGLNKTREKDVALAVVLGLGKRIKETYPDVKIIYTRNTDVFIPLVERANIANRNKADLFISVHCNSATNRTAYGSSTYVLGLHRTEDNLDVAKRENAVIELEDNVDKNYDFNPNSNEGHIIMSMKQNAFLDQSISIAAKIENELEGKENRNSRGVKQAGFFVLYQTSMPSLLAEIGFVSNPTEEMFLASDDGQDHISDAIFRAFSTYKAEMEGKGKPTSAPQDMLEKTGEKSQKPTQEEPEPVKGNNEPPKKAVTANETEKINTAKVIKQAPVVKDTVKPQVPKPVTVAPSVAKAIPAEEKKVPEPVKAAPPKEDSKSAALVFRIQLFASAKPLSAYPELGSAFGEGNIKTEHLPNSNISRYMVGDFPSYAEAEKLIGKASGQGFKDAFVIAYRNGVRLDINESKALRNK